MSEGQLEQSKQFVTSVRKEFEVQDVRQGRNAEKTIMEKLLPIIENNLSFRDYEFLDEIHTFAGYDDFWRRESGKRQKEEF